MSEISTTVRRDAHSSSCGSDFHVVVRVRIVVCKSSVLTLGTALGTPLLLTSCVWFPFRSLGVFPFPWAFHPACFPRATVAGRMAAPSKCWLRFTGVVGTLSSPPHLRRGLDPTTPSGERVQRDPTSLSTRSKTSPAEREAVPPPKPKGRATGAGWKGWVGIPYQGPGMREEKHLDLCLGEVHAVQRHNRS